MRHLFILANEPGFPFVKRLLKILMRDIVIAVVVFVGLLFFFQHRLIWFPHRYGPDYKARLPKNAVELHYTTPEGKQCAFYAPPRDGSSGVPARLWVLFCGNGSVALNWTGLIVENPNKRDGFLLIDYPGYGFCEGSATPTNIAASSEKALSELAAQLHTTVADLEPRLNTLGHSIGCGATLEFAARHPIARVVLVSPFTSLRDMARRKLGWPLCWLLRDNFDNRARIAELAARTQPPRITIFHGGVDPLIPPTMGRSLAAMAPKIATFHEVPEADHNSVVIDAQADIYSAMND